MPKIRTRSGAKKRLKVTASGKIKHKKQGLRHILTKKPAKRKRTLRALTLVHEADMPRIKKTLNI